MLQIRCYKCGNELAKPGALVLGPPDEKTPDVAPQLHICRDCWQQLFKWLCGDTDLE